MILTLFRVNNNRTRIKEQCIAVPLFDFMRKWSKHSSVVLIIRRYLQYSSSRRSINNAH